MGLLSKVSKVLGKAKGHDDDTELASLNKDGRLHSRYVVDEAVSAQLLLDTRFVGTIKDISYGGMAVCFKSLTQRLDLPPKINAIVKFLDRDIACVVQTVRINQQPEATYAGFTMTHDGPETLLFLRDFIEPLRWGESMRLVPMEMRSERYRNPTCEFMRGEGPSDLYILPSPDGKSLVEALLTFRVRYSYYELAYKNGALRTGKTTDTTSVMPGQSIASTDPADPEILRQAACIMAGMRQGNRATIHLLLNEALQALRQGSAPLKRAG